MVFGGERLSFPAPQGLALAADWRTSIRVRILYRRARYVAERAEHTAISRQGAQHYRAMPAIIEELAGVGGHRLGCDPAALGAGQGGGELHQESAFINGASRRSHINATTVRTVPIASTIGVALEGSGTVQDRSAAQALRRRA